jgi:plasmid stabilization system protein ParE
VIHEFHPAARDEFGATVDYYEDALPSLGTQFRDAVKATLDRIDTFPHSGHPTRDGFRRASVSGFPYDLVYRIRADVLELLAIAHHRRRPGYWRERTSP